LSINFDNKLILNLKGSWLVGGALVTLHIGALFIAVILPFSWVLRLALVAAIGISLHSSLMRYAWHKGRHAIRWAEVDADGEWHLGSADAEALGPCTLKGYYAQPWLIIVRLACAERRLAVNLVLAPDAVDSELFRSLRIRLNLQGPGK
jgi:hypothetical protein